MQNAHATTDAGADAATVELPARHARTALLELTATIRRTGGPNTRADDACTPLARVRQRIEATPALDADEKAHVIAILHDIADARGVEITDTDPLTDNTFQAQSALQDALATDTDPETTDLDDDPEDDPNGVHAEVPV